MNNGGQVEPKTMDLNNPFQKSKKIERSPTRTRSQSIPDGSTAAVQQAADLTSALQQNVPTLYNNEEIKRLTMELQAAKKEIEELKKIIETLQPRRSYSPMNSDEEEEIVNRETAWLLPKNKKRKASSSPPKEEKIEKNSKEAPKEQKPPPIVVSNMENYVAIRQNLQSKTLKFNAKMMNNNQLKINVETANDYRNVTKTLTEMQQEWHTYENKQDRPIRVMVRNLHPSCCVQEIIDELKERGFRIIQAENKMKKTKEGLIKLPLFMLTFDKSENIKKIYEIQHLCQMKVKIEAFRTGKLIPQCKKCQRYGHTQGYCQRKPICVKCAGEHLTAECPKPVSAPPKCSNCAEAHPANYRGCTIAKELQKRRDSALKTKKEKSTARTFTSNWVKNGVPYAQIMQSKQNSQTPVIPMTTDQDSRMMQMMQNMMQILNKMNDRLDKLEYKSMGAITKKH